MSLEPLFDGVQNKWGQKNIVVQSETKCIAVSKMSKDIKGKQWNVKGIQCQVWAVDCLFCKYLMPNVLLCFFFISFFLQNIPCKSLAQQQKQDQSLSQQREFIGVTGNKIAEDKKSTRQLVLFHNKAACICSTTRRCLPTSLTSALPALFTCPFQIWLNLRKIICDITWSQLRAFVTNKQKLLLNW